MKLMIVDDHPNMREMIRELAATADDTVCECASGDEAVQKAVEFAPDCVTMDLRMPGMTGFEATRAIVAAHPAVLVVIVSAFDQPVLRVAADAAGAFGYVAKDNLHELRAQLRPSLNRAVGNPTAPKHTGK